MALETGPAVVLTREREDNRELATILRSKGVPVRDIRNNVLSTRKKSVALLPQASS